MLQTFSSVNVASCTCWSANRHPKLALFLIKTFKLPLGSTLFLQHMFRADFTVHGICQWCVVLLLNVLNRGPPSTVTLSEELEELYVHKTNGACRQWLPWKRALPAPYFFQTLWGGWWMEHDSGSRAHTSPAMKIFTRYSSGPVGCQGRPCRMKMFTFLSPLRVTSEPAAILHTWNNAIPHLLHRRTAWGSQWKPEAVDWSGLIQWTRGVIYLLPILIPRSHIVIFVLL